MPKRSHELFVVDILIAIDKIDRYRSDFDSAQDFYHDEKSFDATMRELQIIGEATRHLLTHKILEEEYRIIVDFRNLVVHEYFGVDADEIWDILLNELPRLKETMQALLSVFDREILLEILEAVLTQHHGKTAEYLRELQTQLQTRQ